MIEASSSQSSSADQGHRPTFRQWLYRQRRRDDAVGDIARDVVADDCAKGLRTPRSLRRHIVRKHNPIVRALAAFDSAVEEWEASVTGHQGFATLDTQDGTKCPETS